MAVSYFGEDWLFFDSLNLKSSTGSMEIIFENRYKTEEVVDGGNVNEIGIAFLKDSQIQELAELAKGSDLKFRLNGSGDKAGEDFTGNFTKWMTNYVRDATTIGIGLSQGLEIQ